MSCVFCGIVEGRIPCHEVWEGDGILAFLDIRPIRPGHTLVIPKAHVPHFIDVEDKDYAGLMAASRRIAKAVMGVARPARVGLVIAGFDVPHTHVHVIPLQDFGDIGLRAMPSSRPPAPPAQELAAMAEKLSEALARD